MRDFVFNGLQRANQVLLLVSLCPAVTRVMLYLNTDFAEIAFLHDLT